MSEATWRWKIGILNGFGEAAFEEFAGRVRRLTRMIPMPDGNLIFQKSLIGVAVKDEQPQFEAAGLIVESRDMKDELATELTRAWEGGRIQPVNGSPRFKLS